MATATEFLELESQDGVRMTWNVVPGTKEEATACVIPVATIYTPLKTIASPSSSPSDAAGAGIGPVLLPYSPLRCRICSSVLNPFATVDYIAKIWICPFCFHRNHFPHHYSSISQDNIPVELFPNYTTVEYQSSDHHQHTAPPPPVYLFVVDTCVIKEEIVFLSSALSQAVELLPDTSVVGFITFGTYVQVHELGFGEMPKSYVFKGDKEVSKDQVLEHLGFFIRKPRPTVGVVAGPRDGLSAESISRFLSPISECQFVLNSVLEELEKDPRSVPPGQRATRCTSTALSVAACLLGVCVPGSGARIMAFVGGPSTEGAASIVSKNLSEPIRSHKDLEKSAASLYRKAIIFYEGLSKQLIHQGHVLDLFACSLDQVGVAELKAAVERTGGIIVLAESFGHPVFKDSLRRVFQSSDYDLGLSFNGVFEINCSKDIKVHGILGPCASLEKKGPSCSDSVIGEGNTTAWKFCGLDKQTSLCLVFEIARKDGPDAIGQPASNQFYFQFLTYYQHADGLMRLRATTLSRKWVAGSGCIQDLIAGFDQEAAAAVLARLVFFKMETEPNFDPVKWIDRSLIRLCSRFGDYQKGSPSSFSISPHFSIFPQFMFNLRRSQFVQIFNNSPDETAYYRMVLNRENVANSVVMIQPYLISYSFNSAPEPALLDVTAIAADRILLLDSYFTIVIFHGTTVAQWRNAGYHKQQEHEVNDLGCPWLKRIEKSRTEEENVFLSRNLDLRFRPWRVSAREFIYVPWVLRLFAQLLLAPHNDADAIIKERFPVPRLVVCDQYGSQARFLLARLNPSVTHNSDNPPPGGDVIFTDDVSFQVFMDHLQRLAVQ